MFNLVLNSDHKLIKKVLSDEEAACAADIVPLQLSIDDTTKQRDRGV